MTLSRRLALLSAFGGAAALAAPALAQTARRTFVLVHGAGHGGWCWTRVEDRLRAAGHRVLSPTLTGLGERAHLLTRDVTLATHVDDLLGVFEAEELRDAVLVLHSYAGMPGTVAAERIGARVSRLVYLDALVPRDGESWSDLHPPAVRETVLAAIRDRGEGWKIPVAPAAAFGITDPADQAWVNRRLTPHPAATYGAKAALPRNAAASLSRTYISCTSPALGSLNGVKERVRAEGGWTWREIASGHDAMVIVPDQLARLVAGEA